MNTIRSVDTFCGLDRKVFACACHYITLDFLLTKVLIFEELEWQHLAC